MHQETLSTKKMKNDSKIKASICIKIQDEECYSLLLDSISVGSFKCQNKTKKLYKNILNIILQC